MEPEDAALVARVRGELPYATQSFEALAKRYYPLARRIAVGIVGSLDDAETVVQDVMLRVFHGLKDLREPQMFEAWLRRIIVNAARTFMAKERREREKALLAAAEWDEAFEDDEPAFEESEGVAHLLDGLSVEERTILALKFVEDLEFGEIADIVGQKLSATKMRYYRALKKINEAQSK